MLLRFKNSVKEHRWFVFIALLFLIIYSLICLVNHYLFRTYALDLGTYNRILYNYSHFRADYCEVFSEVPRHHFSDHFDLFLPIISPLQFVFGSYTLLIVQMTFIIAGSFGIYKLSLLKNPSKTLASLAGITFLSYFGVFGAVAFDYHGNVISTALLPWIFYFIELKKMKQILFLSIIFVITKETMILWLAVIFLVLSFSKKYPKQLRKHLFLTSLVLFFIFIIVIKVVMPYFNPEGGLTQLKYSILGNTFGEMMNTFLSKPFEALKWLFQNHLSDRLYDNNKAENWIFILLSGGFLFFYRPRYILMVLPVLALKMYHDNPVVWSIANQYNIEFASVTAIALIETSASSLGSKTKVFFASVVALLCFGVTIRSMDNTEAYADKVRLRVYQEQHYRSAFDTKEIYDLLNGFDRETKISASTMFVPHLYNCKKVYQFPIIKDADYIFIAVRTTTYPLKRKELVDWLIQLSLDKKWQIVHKKDNVFIFKRKSI